jgi:hypothetical protein
MKQLETLKLDFRDPYVKDLSKKIIFLDIETSLVTAKIFRTGNQFIEAKQLQDTTKILTVAYGSLHDLQSKGKEGVTVLSNRTSKNFKKDPHDDSELLKNLWPILDKAEVIVAHNSRFDRGWLLGRYVELGMELPSHFFDFCTFQNLRPFNMTSKKLDELSKNLIGTRKLPTDFTLWERCSHGDVKAFKEMEAYNIGDVYDTLYRLWLRTAYYNANKAIDFANPDSRDIQCKVDGRYLEEYGVYTNRANGLKYYQYKNPRSGQVYVDRYNTNSRKAGLGLVRPR